MRLPPDYDPDLSHILDVHVAEAIVPGAYCVNFLNLARDFNLYMQDQNVDLSHILDIGGRSLPYVYKKKNAHIASYEPRHNYSSAAEKLHSGLACRLLTDPSDIEENLSNYSAIFINVEIGGNALMARQLSSLNEKFIKDQKVFLYKYNFPRAHYGEVMSFYADDGHFIDNLSAQTFLKTISNHMHMGMKKCSFAVMDIWDITRFY